MSTAVYTLQCFMDVSGRRILEARKLLDIPKKWCDGAVTYALLATECALKAALLAGYQAKDITEVSPALHKVAFKSKTGHDLALLWSRQAPMIQKLASSDVRDAIDILHRLDRYHHRYGAKRPTRVHAEPAVVAAELVVGWMKKVVL